MGSRQTYEQYGGRKNKREPNDLRDNRRTGNGTKRRLCSSCLPCKGRHAINPLPPLLSPTQTQLDRAPPPPVPYATFYHPTRLTMPNDIVTGRPKDRKQKKQQTIVIGHKHYPPGLHCFYSSLIFFFTLFINLTCSILPRQRPATSTLLSFD